MVLHWIFFIFFQIIIQSSSQENYRCNKLKCSECIQESGCVWCIKPSNNIHCSTKSQNNTNWCDNKSLIDPQSTHQIIDDRLLSSEKDQVVQLRPQRIKLQLRPHEEYKLNFEYKHSKNYPVDLYYLMDLSTSMDNNRATLATLGKQLEDTMKEITNDFRVGFGIFVDKVALPFTSTTTLKLKNACTKDNPCEPPYSYKNHMSLSTNVNKFVDEVRKAKVSGNIDMPEGGLDALMQVMVCHEEIGWRKNARRLVVFSTDASFHVAGDGKLAGVILPNDAQCHMKNHEYVGAIVYDYPSVSHINYIALQNNINIIFAIIGKSSLQSLYQQFSAVVANSNAGALDPNSMNVVQLIRDNYNKIVTSSAKMNVHSDPSIRVDVAANCAATKGESCSNIALGQTVNYTASITAIACDSNKDNKHKITIKPGALQESIIIEVEVICECTECNNKMMVSQNAKECNMRGDLVCGVCACHSGYLGSICECEENGIDLFNNSKCTTNGEVCSGFGDCKCGECVCFKHVNLVRSGAFCENDDSSCYTPALDGQPCNAHGDCINGMCHCQPGYTGPKCDCPESEAGCIAPGATVPCNGNGRCVCGRCECNRHERDSYDATAYCSVYGSARCTSQLRARVECAYLELHQSSDATNCSGHRVQLVDKFNVDGAENGVRLCSVADDDCHWNYQYRRVEEQGKWQGDEYEIWALKEKCPPNPNLIAWVLGVTGSILVAGIILLLIWKVCTTVHDRREYEKFEKEMHRTKWPQNINPLYKNATTTFQNILHPDNQSQKRF